MVAVNCVVPRITVLEGAGVTVTVETGTNVTVTLEVPIFPSLVAVIVVVPGRSPVTSPDDETLATSGLLEVHETARPVSVLPAASFIVAVNVAV
jgi:hypothetical protein